MGIWYMKTIGDVLTLVLDNETRKKISGQSNLQSEWCNIVEEAFLGRSSKTSYRRSAEKNGIYSEASERDRVTACKVAEHSRIAYIKNNMLYVETDHQGWAQILQTMQRKIILTINKKYPSISVSSIAFLFVNDDEEINREQEKEAVKIIKQRIESNTNKELYGKIKDERLQSILMNLETRINMLEDESN
jgi:hypothetical protein